MIKLHLFISHFGEASHARWLFVPNYENGPMWERHVSIVNPFPWVGGKVNQLSTSLHKDDVTTSQWRKRISNNNCDASILIEGSF